MSIYIRRPEWFRDLMRAEIAASEKRVYTRIKENALGEVCERLELRVSWDFAQETGRLRRSGAIY